ncbi:thioredoxin-like protein 1 isoform X2 [Gordionus sp. m RMFG-2023]|uniref:thioredoxin-like protein 1 isoform X2 n=1 Tax=Gordionus sp. m RMFG-2023 TaxID=3053472 RepID=UPI0031FC0D33
MSNLKHVENDVMFEDEINKLGNKLVIIDFYATWCGPCKTITPHFTSLAHKHPTVTFLKVDVDKCRVQTLQGGNISNMTIIEDKINQLSARDNDEESLIPGYIDLNDFISKNNCECLNSSDKNSFLNCLKNDSSFLESDCDEQLILNITFNQPIRLHSLLVKGPIENGPKIIKLFINQTHTLDFDKALSGESIQTLEIAQKDLTEGNPLSLKYVKFQNVQNISLFVQSNQNDEETTRINYISFIGLPVSHTNMADFKRVAGSKGEVHVGM